MVFPEPDASNVVKRYFHERREEMEEMHDAFGIESRHNTWQQWDDEVRLQSTDQSREFMEELHKFSEYLDRVSHEVHVDFDVKNCTWSDVLGKLRDANDAVAKRMDRDKTFWSKGEAVLVNMSNMFGPALQAIPDELAWLHGGLALVLHLAKGRDKTKRDIVNAFEDVTFTFAIAGNAAEHFPSDPRLCDALDRLRITLFDTIPSLISILVPEKLLRILVVPFRSSKSDRLLESIRDETRRVENRARALTDYHQNQAAKITKDHVREIHDGVLGLQTLQQDILAMVNYALAGQDGMSKMLADAVEVINYHKQKQNTESHPINTNQPSHLRRTSSSPAPDNGKIFTLQCFLDVKRGHETQDLAHVRRQEQEFDTRSKFSVAAIFTNTNFQRWMASDVPDLIHVEGRLDRLYGNTSPISYFCAQLIYQYRESPPTTATLHFFCGQHVASNDPMRGPRGLMRSLVSQVLRVWPMVSLDNSIDFEGYTSLSMQYLCYLFQVVVHQIPSYYTIICVIDGVNRLEKDEWQDEYWALMGLIKDLVDGSDDTRSDDEKVRFKVLITSPGQSIWLRGEKRISEAHRVIIT